MENWEKQARELWGDKWKHALASSAGVAVRTVNRWLSGQHEIKEKIKVKIDKTYTLWREEKNSIE